MKKVTTALLFVFLVLYSTSFLFQEQLFNNAEEKLPLLPPAAILEATAGYLKQVVAEGAFIQSAVFLGGVKPGVPAETYSQRVAHNYLQITSLYPEFQDPYFYAQSYLAGVAPEYTSAANEILDNGRKAYPQNIIFPFFQAYNYFRHLGEPLKASQIFRKASTYPDAPPMFAHLAATLSAEGGMIEAAIISLTALIKSSDDEKVIERYQQELEAFYAALGVQEAVSSYHERFKRYPVKLEELVPQFIDALPEVGPFFELTWTPPSVGLRISVPKSAN